MCQKNIWGVQDIGTRLLLFLQTEKCFHTYFHSFIYIRNIFIILLYVANII